MKRVITIIVVVVIFVPYRMSDYSKDSSFMQDFLVAMVAFAIGGGIGYLVDPPKKDEDSEVK